ncbi:MAG: ribonuclease Y [Clostridia bacterium]|nr:ribonuclease Y [Clostridia bacterium]
MVTKLALVIAIIVSGVVFLAIGGFASYFITGKMLEKKLGNAKNIAEKTLKDAEEKASTIKKEAVLEAKEEALKLKTDSENECRERRAEIQKMEVRILEKEEALDRKNDSLDKKLQSIDDAKQELENKKQDLENMKQDIVLEKEKIVKELEKVAGLSKEEAKKQVVDSIIDEARKEAGNIVRDIEQEARDEGEKKARDIITLAIQKCATDQTADVTVTTVALPTDEMKGRIIGREGRNIRAIENATGVDLIVDDTPDAVILSSFDPIRREVARLTLEKLITDGRIHPARVEDIVEKVKKDIEKTIKEAGENASFEAGVYNLHPELIKVLGRLKYRTSYGQNVLKHSLETSYIAGLLAGELGVNVAVAKRGGLLHDIGKALDFEMEGTHVSIGVDVAKKFKESPEVIHCIEAHHGGVEYKSIEAMLVQVADAISSARPGARRESLDAYVKRLEKLEAIAKSFKGVEASYAIQAGREVRIAVKPEEVDDASMVILAKEIARKIEAELEYPGQIKVNIIRETRATDVAS